MFKDLSNTVSYAFLCLFKANQKQKVVTKNKMENPTFVNEEEIPLINQDEGYDDYRTPDTSRVDTS